MERRVETEDDRNKLRIFISKQKLPFTVKVTDGRSRSIDQNKLYRRWLLEAADQRGMSMAELEAEWKLRHGIPILLAENEAFAAAWEATGAKCTYERQLTWMPMINVTSLMTVTQMKAFLDTIEHECLTNAIEITDTERLRSGTRRARVDRGHARHGDPGVGEAPHRAAPKKEVP
jgi:hypothetical protein